MRVLIVIVLVVLYMGYVVSQQVDSNTGKEVALKNSTDRDELFSLMAKTKVLYYSFGTTGGPFNFFGNSDFAGTTEAEQVSKLAVQTNTLVFFVPTGYEPWAYGDVKGFRLTLSCTTKQGLLSTYPYLFSQTQDPTTVLASLFKKKLEKVFLFDPVGSSYEWKSNRYGGAPCPIDERLYLAFLQQKVRYDQFKATANELSQ
jgi:hypothetical protein